MQGQSFMRLKEHCKVMKEGLAEIREEKGNPDAT